MNISGPAGGFEKAVPRKPFTYPSSLKGPFHLVDEYILDKEASFNRIFDASTESQESTWVFAYEDIDDHDLANKFDFLNYADPYVMEVMVPAGHKVKAWAEMGSQIPCKYEIELTPNVAFVTLRILPAPHQINLDFSNYKFVYKERVTKAYQAIRLYDKENFQMRGWWLFSPHENLANMSPQEIQTYYSLPFTPKYVCDVTTSPDFLVEAYFSKEKDGPALFAQLGPLKFSNERKLSGASLG